MVRALVIGGSGLVGGRLLAMLAQRGIETLGTARSRLRPGLAPLDITDAAAVRDLVGSHRPSIIFLAAALTAVDYCEDHPEEAHRANADAPGVVARAAAQVSARLILYSTEYVFDGKAGPYGEGDPISPQGVYARSKAEGERAVREVLDDHLIIRTTVVFGWDPSSKNFAMQVDERLSAGQRMRVPADQVGNPTLVDFLVEATLELCDRDAWGQTVNVVGRDRVPRTELAVRLASRLGLDPGLIDPVATSELGQRAPRPLNAGLKTVRLASILGSPPMPLDVAIDRFAEARRLARG